MCTAIPYGLILGSLRGGDQALDQGEAGAPCRNQVGSSIRGRGYGGQGHRAGDRWGWGQALGWQVVLREDKEGW